MRWAGGVAVVKGKGDCKEEVDLDREDQESRLNLYKAGLTLEQIESKVDLINSGLTITKAVKDKVEAHVPEGGEFVEIENEAEVETSYPTYVVDQDTGEILIVEQITGFEEDLGRDSPESGSKSHADILPDDFGQNTDLNSLDVQESNSESNDLKKEMLVTGDDFESYMLADVERMPCVWQAGAVGERYVESEAPSEEEDNLETETGPLDGQVMQIDLSDNKFGDDVGEFGDENDLMVNFEQVRFIRLEQEEQLMEEEQELEEEMLQTELETEYILEDGKLRKINNNETPPVSNHEEDESDGKIEKVESLVMLAEDGSAHIVVGGEEHPEHIQIGDQYVLGSEDVHYVLGHEDDGNFVLHNLEEVRENEVESNNVNSEVNNIEGDFIIQEDNEQIEDDVGTPGDHLVLEHKDHEENKPVSLKQRLKEIKRRNLLLERRDGELDNVVTQDQEVDVGDGEVIHQSELLDGGLVTGYLVLGDGDQVVLGDEHEGVSEGGQDMVFLEENQIVFKDGEKSLLRKEGLELPEGDHFIQINERAFDNSSEAVSRQMEGEQELTETNQYIQVVEEQTEPTGSEQISCTAHSLSRVVGGWSELGGQEQEYDRKFVSKPRVETTGRVSQGTVVCQWTKMPGDRVRVAHSKIIVPRMGQSEQEAMLDSSGVDISAPLVYSTQGSVWRDVGSQVVPHRVSGMPSDKEEERRQADRIQQFLSCGGVLDRSCPGCGKVMSR